MFSMPGLTSENLAEYHLYESRFLLHISERWLKRHRKKAFTPRDIRQTVPDGWGLVMIWGVSPTIATSQIINTSEMFWNQLLSPISTTTLSTRLQFMDDNNRPHRSQAVRAYFQNCDKSRSESAGHIWDILGHQIQAVEPPVQNLREL